MPVTSKVAFYGGVPTFFIDGKPLVGMAYITCFEERNCYRDFAEAGYKLYSFITYFGDQTINELSGINPFSKGIFSEKNKADFSVFDSSVKRILAVCPEAMIFPRVNMELPSWWEQEHPEECNDSGTENFPEHHRLCFSSKLWLEQTAEFLRIFIAHIESMPWRDHICSYQLSCGNTEEWFSFDQVGSIGRRTREAFAQQGGDIHNIADFRLFLSRQVADSIACLAHVVKEATQYRLAVGTFYGYTLETPTWDSCHLALNRLLASRDIDFLCSPVSYMCERQPGHDMPCMTVLDSLKLHGKLYFAELDIRTYLTRHPNSCRPGAVRTQTYEDSVWSGPKSPEVCRWMLRLNVARQISHGYSSWWFDMWGRWFDTPEFMQEIKVLRIIAEDLFHCLHRESLAEVAVFVDETSYAQFERGDVDLIGDICYFGRKPLGLAGAPYDIYEINDFEAVVGRYKAIVFLAPAMTEAVMKAMKRCEDNGIKYIIFDAEHPKVTIERLREHYRNSGVFTWIDTDDVVFASRHFLAIHAVTGGVKTVHLPWTTRIEALLPAGVEQTGNTIQVDLKQFETRLYRLCY